MTNTKADIVKSIYTCLEMLRMGNENLYSWWCGMLYEADGTPCRNAWSQHHLTIMENDCIYNIPLER